jgi:hypothetical protein
VLISWVIGALPALAGFPAILLEISPSICCADTGVAGSLPDELLDDEWGTLSILSTM